MSIFDKKGMLLFPKSDKRRKTDEGDDLIVFTKCFCPNGHNLVNSKAKFKEFDGILLDAKNDKESGVVALSPIYGCKTRVSVGIELEENKQYQLSCPECKAQLPFYSKCHCKGDIAILFLNKKRQYNSFLGVCNRVGCTNSYIQIGHEIITSARLENH